MNGPEAPRLFVMPPFERFVDDFAYQRGGATIRFSLAGGDIGSRLQDWRRAFGDRLLLYDYRLLKSEPLRVLQSIEAFLDLPAYFTQANFNNLHLNAGVRRNSRLVSYVLAQERLIATLDRLVPDRFLIAGARWLYQSLTTDAAPAAPSPESSLTGPPVPALLADRQAVAALFATSALIVGSGAPAASR